MTKFQLFEVAPKTRPAFIAKYKTDYIFRNWCNVYGISVIGDNVLFPNGKIANKRTR